MIKQEYEKLQANKFLADNWHTFNKSGFESMYNFILRMIIEYSQNKQIKEKNNENN